MRFIVDADSFPVQARNVLLRASEKHVIAILFVARKKPELPKNELVSFQSAPPGEGSADAIIVAAAKPQDMVFTRDIPLAETLVLRGITVLNDRGDVHSADTIAERRSIRDAMAGLRAAGFAAMPGKSYSQKELAAFANAFDRELRKRLPKSE